MHKIPASHENYGGKFWRKIYAENSGGKLSQKNLGGKFWQKILAENLGASQNLGRYTEFRRLIKIQAPD